MSFNRLLALVVALVWFAPVRGDEPAGAAIYLKQCARCHGKAGEGAKAYPHPLVGNRSLEQLTKYIAKEMPENDPGSCVGVDAENVAAFVFNAFYSPAAQAKIKPPRVELSRLTVGEYRNAVADLVAPLRGAEGSSKSEPGLRGEYFSYDEKRNRKPTFGRVDGEVRFDFNAKDQGLEKLTSNDIAAKWQGSVLATETGLHEFVVKTEHSASLWINDLKKPLIDASVKSGADTEFRGSIFLLAGRAYPLKLEFSRTTLGVRKERKEKSPPAPTTVALEWKQPKRALEVVSARNLRTDGGAKSFALSVAFPPDDRSAGYERGNSVSKAWVQAATDGAIDVATYVSDNLAELSGVRNDAPDRKAQLKDYCVKFVEQAFRRPLTPEQKALYVDRQFEVAKDDETAVKRVVLMTLESPRFLFREPATAAGDAYDAAARLSFGLWDSLPDRDLLKAVAAGRLATRDDAVREARRMLDDPRARVKFRGIVLQWLKADQIGDVIRDPQLFPDFNARVVSDLRTSLELFVDDVVWSEPSDYRRFFTSDALYLNGRLAKIYGGDLPADAPFQKAIVKPGERAGVVTHPLLLANLAYTSTSSPIHRGVFLARNVLGVTLRQPPDAFTPLPAEAHPNLNTRERIALQTRARECMSCHNIINPLGFTLERYDAIGRLRDEENGKPIDSSGSFVTRSADIEKFKDAQDLAKYLADSDEASETFVARIFHSMVKQPVLAFGPDKLNELRRGFVESGYDVRRLVVEIAVLNALPERRGDKKK